MTEEERTFMGKLRSKAIAAIGVTASLLVLSSAPAPAVANALTATDGEITTTVGSLQLGSLWNPGPPCGATTGGITLDVVPLDPGEELGWNTTVTAADIVTSIGVSGGTYRVEVTKFDGGSQAGFIDDPTGDVVFQDAVLRFDFFSTTGTPPNCVKGTRVCTLKATFEDLSGHAFDLPDPDTGAMALGDILVLAGDGTLGSIFPLSCTAPFATLVSTTVEFDPMELTA